MSKAIDYSAIKKCLISKASKDDWDNHLTELENLEKMMDVIRNFMSDERNFEYIDGHLKLSDGRFLGRYAAIERVSQSCC